jgi:hypothetical protein
VNNLRLSETCVLRETGFSSAVLYRAATHRGCSRSLRFEQRAPIIGTRVIPFPGVAFVH